MMPCVLSSSKLSMSLRNDPIFKLYFYRFALLVVVFFKQYKRCQFVSTRITINMEFESDFKKRYIIWNNVINSTMFKVQKQ
ncbi:hypothetical protein Plhal304r1_c017g0061351 [Plasmopara halstedii]